MAIYSNTIKQTLWPEAEKKATAKKTVATQKPTMPTIYETPWAAPLTEKPTYEQKPVTTPIKEMTLEEAMAQANTQNPAMNQQALAAALKQYGVSSMPQGGVQAAPGSTGGAPVGGATTSGTDGTGGSKPSYKHDIKEMDWVGAEEAANKNALIGGGGSGASAIDGGDTSGTGGDTSGGNVTEGGEDDGVTGDDTSGTGGKSTRGPMDLATYLREYGSNTEETFNRAIKKAREQYDQSVRLANDEMYRAMMTYGKNAEALAAGGLTGSGVSGYGDHVAYAARQGAVATAGAAQQGAIADAAAAKQEADAVNARSFSEYLRQYEANEAAKAEQKNAARSNAFNTILSSGITDANAAAEMLRQTGYFTEEEIASLAGIAVNFAATQKKETQETVDAGNVAAATDAYNNMLAQGYTPEAATKQIETLYGADVANTVKGNQAQVLNTQVVDQIKNLDGKSLATGVVAQLDEAVKSGAVSNVKDETGVSEYDRLLADAQGKNVEFLSKVFTNARTEYWVEDAAAALGLTLEEGMDEETAADAVLNAAKERVIQMFREGDLSAEGASELLLGSFEKDLETAKSENKNNAAVRTKSEITVLYNAKEDSKKLGVDQYYTDALAAFMESVTFEENNGVLYIKDGGATYVAIAKDKLERKSEREDKGKDVVRATISAGNGDSEVLKGDLPEVLIDLYEYWKKTQGSSGAGASS